MDHPQAVNTLATERYLLGEMTEQEQQAFEAHYFDCPECAEDLRTGALMTDGARAGLISAATVTELRPRPGSTRQWRLAVAIPWATAATLALVVGYQSVARGPVVAPLTSLVALAPVTLRPASRGQEAVVRLLPNNDTVALAVDLGDVTASQAIPYELRRANGSTVASGTVPVPALGSPLLLLVPARLLAPAEHYVLTLNRSENSSLTTADYRFIVEAR